MPTPILTYYGSVKDGAISLPSAKFKSEVTNAFDGMAIEVTVKRKKKTRSSLQNRYYWSVVIPCLIDGFIDLGNNDLQVGNPNHHEMLHQLMKDKFLFNGVEVADANGEVLQLPSTTKSCNTLEFMEYLDNITQWASECLQITIPEPNEQTAFAL